MGSNYLLRHSREEPALDSDRGRESRACPVLDTGFFRGQWIPARAGMALWELGWTYALTLGVFCAICLVTIDVQYTFQAQPVHAVFPRRGPPRNAPMCYNAACHRWFSPRFIPSLIADRRRNGIRNADFRQRRRDGRTRKPAARCRAVLSAFRNKSEWRTTCGSTGTDHCV